MRRFRKFITTIFTIWMTFVISTTVKNVMPLHLWLQLPSDTCWWVYKYIYIYIFESNCSHSLAKASQPNYGFKFTFSPSWFIFFFTIMRWSFTFKQQIVYLGFFLLLPHKVKCCAFISFKVLHSPRNRYFFSFIMLYFHFFQNFLFNFFSLRVSAFNIKG